MRCTRGNGGEIGYESRRVHAGARAAAFRGKYRPTRDIFRAQPGSLEYFLTERYCLYAESVGHIFRCEIDHAPWPLQPAEADVEQNSMTAPLGITLRERRPLLHFARFQDVHVWRPRRIG